MSSFLSCAILPSMKDEDGRTRLYKALAVILGLLVILAVFLLFRPNTINVEIEEEERTSIIDLPGLGEKSDPLEKKEADVDIRITPQYNGSFSWDKIGDYLEDPSELIDETSINIEGSIRF